MKLIAYLKVWPPDCLSKLVLWRVRPGQNSKINLENRTMKTFLLKQYVRMQTLLADESGQDLIEYALVVALIAFAATAGMSTVAGNINTAFTKIGSKLTTYVT
jgi:pilus assembly protein Flp/PilA